MTDQSVSRHPIASFRHAHYIKTTCIQNLTLNLDFYACFLCDTRIGSAVAYTLCFFKFRPPHGAVTFRQVHLRSLISSLFAFSVPCSDLRSYHPSPRVAALGMSRPFSEGLSHVVTFWTLSTRLIRTLVSYHMLIRVILDDHSIHGHAGP